MTLKSSYLNLDELKAAAKAQGLDVDKTFRGIYNDAGNLVGTFNLSDIGEVTNVKAV